MRRLGPGICLGIIFLFLMSAFSGCGSDENSVCLCPEAPQQPLARLTFSFGGSVATAPADFVYFKVEYPDAVESPVLCNLKISDGDSSRVINLNSETSPAFDDFMALLLNGSDEQIKRSIGSGDSHGWSVSTLYPESDTLYDVAVYSGYPDLKRQQVERVEAVVTKADVKSPGRDPNGDGNWVDLHVAVEVQFFGSEQ